MKATKTAMEATAIATITPEDIENIDIVQILQMLLAFALSTCHLSNKEGSNVYSDSSTRSLLDLASLN